MTAGGSPAETGRAVPQPDSTSPLEPDDSRASDSTSHASEDARRRVAPVQLESSAEGPKVTLHKEGQTFVYRCATGEEEHLIQRLMDQAHDPEHPLTWFDAARVAHRLGGQLGQRLHQVRFGETAVNGLSNRMTSSPEDR